MLELTTATNHADAYTWAAVLLAHFAIGGAFWAVLAVLWRRCEPSPHLAALTASIAYLAAWEWIVQGFAAGWQDALVDWSAVTLGAICASALWHHRSRLGMIGVAAVSVIALAGIGRRK